MIIALGWCLISIEEKAPNDFLWQNVLKLTDAIFTKEDEKKSIFRIKRFRGDGKKRKER